MVHLIGYSFIHIAILIVEGGTLNAPWIALLEWTVQDKATTATYTPRAEVVKNCAGCCQIHATNPRGSCGLKK